MLAHRGNVAQQEGDVEKYDAAEDAVQVQVVAPVDVPLAVVEASIVQEVFLLEETLLASVLPAEGERGFGGVAYGQMWISVWEFWLGGDVTPFSAPSVTRGASWPIAFMPFSRRSSGCTASSEMNSTLARGGGAARAARARAPPGLAKAKPSGPQKN